jgi:hypothetical protein
MRKVTVGTAATLLAPAGDRDYIAIFNNDSNSIFICFDGDDGILNSPVSLALTTGFSNSATVTSVVVATPEQVVIGQLFSGTGVPAGVYVTAINLNNGTLTLTSFTATAGSSGNYTFGSTLTTSNGFPIPAATNIILSNDAHRNVWNKAIYAISVAGGADVRIQGA